VGRYRRRPASAVPTKARLAAPALRERFRSASAAHVGVENWEADPKNQEWRAQVEVAPARSE